ncbi:MAG: hypothetical protein ACD_84C00032G0001 [uncultured bacterium]|nr:MAG: hypothetical protein ACD_84C00032G0001 [uncultured bacterium]
MSMALMKALSEIKARIPKPILEAVFLPRDIRWRQTPPSIDEQIMSLVMRPRVLVDCNLVGGTEVYIPLASIIAERMNDYTSVYRIPKELTQGRSINSVINITFSDPSRISNPGMSVGQQNTTMMIAGAAVMNAMSSVPITSTAKVQLIAENVVMVRDSVMLPSNIYLRCILANDENMSHLQMRSYRHFANLGVYAVKAYIYNNYVIPMDLGEMHSGQVLGRFKEIIDSYADSEELYQTYLTEKMEKVLFMNDSESFTRHLKLLIGSSR